MSETQEKARLISRNLNSAFNRGDTMRKEQSFVGIGTFEKRVGVDKSERQIRTERFKKDYKDTKKAYSEAKKFAEPLFGGKKPKARKNLRWGTRGHDIL